MAKHALDFVRRIVLGIARKYPDYIDRDELIGAGALAYVQAQLRYKSELGVFAHYATIKIRGAVLDSMRRQDNRTDKSKRVSAQGDNLIIASEYLVEAAVDGGVSAHDSVERSDLLSRIPLAMLQLLPRERVVVYGRFFKDMSQHALGAVLGISNSRVSQIEAAAVRKMRKTIEGQ